MSEAKCFSDSFGFELGSQIGKERRPRAQRPLKLTRLTGRKRIFDLHALALSFTLLLSSADALASCFSVFTASDSATELSEITTENAMGSRGFISSFPAPNEQRLIDFQKRAISWWGIELYVVRTIEEARAHDLKAEYAADQGLYIVAPQVRIESLVPEATNQSQALFEEVAKQTERLVWFKNPNRLAAPQDRVLVEANPQSSLLNVFDSKTVRLRERALNMGPHFIVKGWTYPTDVYGVFEFKDLKQSQSTYKTLLSRARKLFREGHRFGFSRTEADFVSDLMIASETDRTNQRTVGNGYYSIEDHRNEALDSFRAGRAFTIRVTDPSGQSLGGILVRRNGNLMDFETTFYRERGGILFSQIAALILFERLEKQGVDRLFIEMISAFSKGLKAKPADIAEGANFNEALAKASTLTFDFSSDWVPPGL